jgi:hypothetical protein
MPFSIVDGVNEIIDDSLDINLIRKPPLYKQPKSCLLLNSHPPSFDAYDVICQIFDRIEQNFNHAGNRSHTLGPSKENWRFEKILYIAPKNTSPEKLLEKAVANLPDKDWVNQVPTSSGVINSASDKLRNIDLVHRLKVGFYEFIELKIDSDTPLFAAFEIIINGLIYLLSRKNYEEHHLDGKELLVAKDIYLQTLAPRKYYSRYKLDWLEKELNRGLSKFIEEIFKENIRMKFSFLWFPENFDCSCKNEKLLYSLNNRSSVSWKVPPN